MDALRKLTLLVGVTLLALSLVAGPAMAQEDTADPAEGEVETVEPQEEADDGDHRIAIAESPRDRLGLLLLGSLVLAGAFGLLNARRQLKGDRPSASGEFRWR